LFDIFRNLLGILQGVGQLLQMEVLVKTQQSQAYRCPYSIR